MRKNPRQRIKVPTTSTNFFERPRVDKSGESGRNRQRQRSKPIHLEPMVVNRRLHKSVGSKWGPRKSRFQKFLDFLRGR